MKGNCFTFNDIIKNKSKAKSLCAHKNEIKWLKKVPLLHYNWLLYLFKSYCIKDLLRKD